MALSSSLRFYHGARGSAEYVPANPDLRPFAAETWRCDYNQVRPHSALGYLTPAEFAQRSAAPSGCARMAPPDEDASSGGESVIAGVVLENPKPEKVSLSLD